MSTKEIGNSPKRARRIGKQIANFAALSLAIAVPLQALAAMSGAPTVQTANQQGTPINTISVDWMDKQANPGKDFYDYSNGTWLKNTPIPGDYANWGVFNILNEQNLVLVHKIAEDAASRKDAPAGSIEKKIGDFYAVGMDEKRIEEDGIKPMQPELDRIQAIKDTKDIQDVLTHLQQMNINVLFGYSSGPDFKDSSKTIAQAGQGGLGLPDRDYYINTDDNSVKIRQQYLTHIAKVFVLLGDDQEKADAKAKRILAFETKLAEASMKNTDLRVPENVYHKMTVEKSNELTPHFSWTKYNADLGYPNIKEINIGQPDFFKEADKRLTDSSVDEWKEYITWRLVDDASPYLSDKFVSEQFDFDGRILQGKKENLVRWKRVINSENKALGEALGQLYVAQAFTPEAKAKALRLVHELKDTLREDIKKLDWMTDATKKNALAKLEMFHEKIGYPDKWRDYGKLEVGRDSYVWNVLKAERFDFNRQLDKIGKPIDRNEWLMTPQTVNAYYWSEMNEIVFPAGILQPPIYNPNADDATNLGAMGSVIGHEMTHGFDDQGSKFDGAGNLRDWWTAEDKERFQQRVDKIVTQFDSYTVAGDTKVRGKLVSGEAAADLGGVTIAYKTLERTLGDKPREKDANGFTPEQRFFISFAQAFKQNTRPERERLIANTNPHPSPRLRVNGTMANMEPFVKAFSLPDDSPIMLPADQRCHIW